MKNQKHFFQFSLGIGILVVAFMLLLGITCLLYGVFSNSSGFKAAAFYPQDVSFYVGLPKEILQSNEKVSEGISQLLAQNLPGVSDYIAEHNLNVKEVFALSEEIHFGSFIQDGKMHSLVVLKIDPESANTILSSVAERFVAISDGTSGSFSTEKDLKEELVFEYVDGYLLVSSEKSVLDSAKSGWDSSLKKNTVYRNTARNVPADSGVYYFKSQDLYDLIGIKAGGLEMRRTLLPFIADDTSFAGFIDLFDGGLRMRISGSEQHSVEKGYDYSRLLGALPSSVNFVSFGSFPADPSASKVETGVNLSDQYQLITHELESRYGFTTEDAFFKNIFDHFALYGITYKDTQQLGIVYELSEADKDEHINELEKRILDTFAYESVEESEFELSDGTIAIEFVPGKKEYIFAQDLQTAFLTPYEKGPSGNPTVAHDSFSYKYVDGLMFITASMGGARGLFRAADKEPLLSKDELNYYSSMPENFVSGVYFNSKSSFSPLKNTFISKITALDNGESLDILFYID